MPVESIELIRAKSKIYSSLSPSLKFSALITAALLQLDDVTRSAIPRR